MIESYVNDDPLERCNEQPGEDSHEGRQDDNLVRPGCQVS